MMLMMLLMTQVEQMQFPNHSLSKSSSKILGSLLVYEDFCLRDILSLNDISLLPPSLSGSLEDDDEWTSSSNKMILFLPGYVFACYEQANLLPDSWLRYSNREEGKRALLSSTPTSFKRYIINDTLHIFFFFLLFFLSFFQVTCSQHEFSWSSGWTLSLLLSLLLFPPTEKTRMMMMKGREARDLTHGKKSWYPFYASR